MSLHLHIDSLQLRLEDFQLGPIRLKMNRTDYLVLLGPTGCGKTTLIKCIIGAHGTFPGRILLDRHDIGVLPPNKRKVGYVAQVTDLFPHLTVRENIGFGLKYMKLTPAEHKALVGKYLELFGLEKMEGRLATTLSGGESKKVALARSLIVEPKLLLLDEPLGMLDHNKRKEMIEVLRMIHDELQTTIIHVTHDRHEAWSVAQTCAVMNEGKILETGSVAQLFRAPSSRFVAEFLGGVNIFKADFGRDEVRTSWASLRLVKELSFASGWLLIRPEQISLVEKHLSHRISGTVADRRDFGEYIEPEVLVGDSDWLTVHSSIEGASRTKVGQQAYLNWPESAMHVFTGEE